MKKLEIGYSSSLQRFGLIFDGSVECEIALWHYISESVDCLVPPFRSEEKLFLPIDKGELVIAVHSLTSVNSTRCRVEDLTVASKFNGPSVLSIETQLIDLNFDISKGLFGYILENNERTYGYCFFDNFFCFQFGVRTLPEPIYQMNQCYFISISDILSRSSAELQGLRVVLLVDVMCLTQIPNIAVCTTALSNVVNTAVSECNVSQLPSTPSSAQMVKKQEKKSLRRANSFKFSSSVVSNLVDPVVIDTPTITTCNSSAVVINNSPDKRETRVIQLVIDDIAGEDHEDEISRILYKLDWGYHKCNTNALRADNALIDIEYCWVAPWAKSEFIEKGFSGLMVGLDYFFDLCDVKAYIMHAMSASSRILEGRVVVTTDFNTMSIEERVIQIINKNIDVKRMFAFYQLEDLLKKIGWIRRKWTLLGDCLVPSWFTKELCDCPDLIPGYHCFISTDHQSIVQYLKLYGLKKCSYGEYWKNTNGNKQLSSKKRSISVMENSSSSSTKKIARSQTVVASKPPTGVTVTKSQRTDENLVWNDYLKDCVAQVQKRPNGGYYGMGPVLTELFKVTGWKKIYNSKVKSERVLCVDHITLPYWSVEYYDDSSDNVELLSLFVEGVDYFVDDEDIIKYLKLNGNYPLPESIGNQKQRYKSTSDVGIKAASKVGSKPLPISASRTAVREFDAIVPECVATVNINKASVKPEKMSNKAGVVSSVEYFDRKATDLESGGVFEKEMEEIVKLTMLGELNPLIFDKKSNKSRGTQENDCKFTIWDVLHDKFGWRTAASNLSTSNGVLFVAPCITDDQLGCALLKRGLLTNNDVSSCIFDDSVSLMQFVCNQFNSYGYSLEELLKKVAESKQKGLKIKFDRKSVQLATKSIVKTNPKAIGNSRSSNFLRTQMIADEAPGHYDDSHSGNLSLMIHDDIRTPFVEYKSNVDSPVGDSQSLVALLHHYSPSNDDVGVEKSYVEELQKIEPNFEKLFSILRAEHGWSYDFLKSKSYGHIAVPIEYQGGRIYLHPCFSKDLKEPILNEHFFFTPESVIQFLRSFVEKNPVVSRESIEAMESPAAVRACRGKDGGKGIEKVENPFKSPEIVSRFSAQMIIPDKIQLKQTENLTFEEKIKNCVANLSVTDDVESLQRLDSSSTNLAESMLSGRKDIGIALYDLIWTAITERQGFVINVHGPTSFGKTTLTKHVATLAIKNLSAIKKNPGCELLYVSNCNELLARVSETFTTPAAKSNAFPGNMVNSRFRNERMVIVVVDEADLSCPGLSSKFNNSRSGKNELEMRKLINAATVDGALIVLICIGNHPLLDFPNADVISSGGRIMSEGRKHSLFVPRYTDEALKDIVCSRLNGLVNVEKSRPALMFLAKKAVNETSSTRFILQALSGILKNKKKDLNSDEIVITMAEVNLSQKPTNSKADILFSHTCKHCKVLLDVFAKKNWYSGSCSFNKTDASKAYFEHISLMKMVDDDANSVTVHECLRSHLVPMGVLNEGSARGGVGPKYSVLISIDDYTLYKRRCDELNDKNLLAMSKLE